MYLKRILFALSFVLLMRPGMSQSAAWCDSSFSSCDSIITGLSNVVVGPFGDWITITIKVQHNALLYAPSFIICPNPDTIGFVNQNFSYFGLMGPTTTTLSYNFLNFAFLPGDTINGYIIVDNTLNGFENCQVPFSTVVPNYIGIDEPTGKGVLGLFPNPSSGRITVTSSNSGPLYIYDSMGRQVAQYVVNEGQNIVDLSSLGKGAYYLRLGNTVSYMQGRLIVQ